MDNLVVTKEEGSPLSMHPKKFALWIFIVTVIMLFAAWTSGYIVRKAEGNWLNFDLPTMMYYATGVLLVSSFTMHWAFLSAKKDNLDSLKIALVATTFLGFLFLAFQLLGFNELVSNNVWFGGKKSNPSGSFLYVLSGMHGLHIVGGIVFLLITLLFALKKQIHAKNLLLIEMCVTFWHFLDGLWLYLFLFLLLNR